MTTYRCPCGATESVTRPSDDGDPGGDPPTPPHTEQPPRDADGGLPLCHTCNERVAPTE